MSWEILGRHKKAIQFARTFNLHPIVANILLMRGLDTEEQFYKFLYPKIDDLHSPYLFLEMKRAVKRIMNAVERREKILIIGDYDADGITGTVILYNLIKFLKGEVSCYIPDRLTHGYGVKKEDIEVVKKSGAKLVITVDNGIKACDFAEALREVGVDFIITDHHEAGDELPSAYAILNPKVEGCLYPFKELSGSGVAFKIAEAILKEKGFKSEIKNFIKWAALGTVADMMKIIGENRVIVKLGIEEIKKLPMKGLEHILKFSGLKKEDISTDTIAYRIAPRINVAGRLESPDIIFKLFTEEIEEKRVIEIAHHINKLNSKRQAIVEKIIKEATRKIKNENLFKNDIIVVDGEGWHKGVLGIAAIRLANKFKKPVLLIGIDGDTGYGSGRTYLDVPILDELERVKELFDIDGEVKFGGHLFAVGFHIKRENIELLKKAMEKVLVEEDKKRKDKTFIAEAILHFGEINDTLLYSIEQISPFGAGNPKPLFASYKVYVEKRSSKNGNIYMSLKSLKRQFTGSLRREDFQFKSGFYNILYYPMKKNGNIFLEIVDIQ